MYVFNYYAPGFHKPNIKIKNFAEMVHPNRHLMIKT